MAWWVADRIDQMGDGSDFGECTAFGVSGKDGILGGVVFNNWIPRYRSVEVSFASASPRWLTRPIIKSIMSYPFDKLECERVTALTPSRTASARRFLQTFGFVKEGEVRKGFGDDDAVISGLLKEEWLASRWSLDGKVHTQAPHAPRSRSDGERAGGGEPSHGAAGSRA